MSGQDVSDYWTQFKGKVKEKWGHLTDDDFDVIAGRREQLLGRIRERHALSHDEAEAQVTEWERHNPGAFWFEKS